MATLAIASAAAAGALAGAAVALAAEGSRLAGRLAGLARLLATPLVRAGRGRPVRRMERYRLAGAFATGGFVGGSVLIDPLAGLAIAALAPWAVARLLAWRAARFRSAVDGQVPELATALANALAGGHSIRGAIAQAASELSGPAGAELRRVAAELAVGAPMEGTLEKLRQRVGSHRLDVVLAAVLIQRQAGGDLARLLREVAEVAEDRRRLAQEARTASAQARFTGKVVVVLPAAAAGLGELVSPGLVSASLRSFAGAWLVGLAVLLQVAAALVIRRIARIGIG